MEKESEEVEPAAMATRNRYNQKGSFQRYSKTEVDKSSLKCTHCNQSGHTIDMCFELVGYPDWWDQYLDRKKETKKNSGAPMASTKKGKDSMVISASVARTGNDGHHNEANNWLWC
ncbi:uncharacterized protein LOC113310693 [Papaver somniferum]|uniref:uncharacterized protein LOC113310693 n=1 Tax=Papaver somniferum TaxID=3469 RepID=UPI000E6FCC57|nr:uncharacterized protein LOC113310693 [Papaver somniferum]